MGNFTKIFKPLLLLFLFLLVIISFIPTISAATIKTTTDPMRIGVGARALGMGKAFVGLANDSTAIFLNPAGLAQMENWQLTSMSTKLIQEIDYITIGGVYPTAYGNFGFGYIGASIGGSFVTDLDLVEDPEGRIIVVPGTSNISYTNSVMLLSYSRKARELLNYDFLDKVLFGINFKLYQQSLTGVAEEGQASGTSTDLGFIYEVNDWMNVGINAVNFISTPVSGIGVDQTIPSTLKIGTSVKIMGEKSIYGGESELYGLLDLDSSFGQVGYPVLWHAGLEYWPNKYLALRLGMDQDLAGDSAGAASSNLCSGVGFLVNDFRFDYAFHQYGGLSSNDTHYVSISYGFAPPPKPVEIVTEEPKVEEPTEKSYFKIFAPADQIRVYDENIKIIGQVVDPSDVKRLTINNVEAPLTSDGSFEVLSRLQLGKNVYDVKAFDAEGKMLKSEKIRLLRLISFKDIKDDYWAKEPIEMLAVLGMTGGYPDGTFRADKDINRAELTTMLVRAKGYTLPPMSEQLFSDLPKKHWAAKFVQVGVSEKLVTGYPDGTFKPAKSITRAEGVTVLVRFAELELPQILVEGPYSDVPGRHWAAQSVSAAKSAGMLDYLAGKPFEPNKSLSRAETVEILSKTPFAAAKIADLKDFNTY